MRHAARRAARAVRAAEDAGGGAARRSRLAEVGALGAAADVHYRVRLQRPHAGGRAQGGLACRRVRRAAAAGGEPNGGAARRRSAGGGRARTGARAPTGLTLLSAAEGTRGERTLACIPALSGEPVAGPETIAQRTLACIPALSGEPGLRCSARHRHPLRGHCGTTPGLATPVCAVAAGTTRKLLGHLRRPLTGSWVPVRRRLRRGRVEGRPHRSRDVSWRVQEILTALLRRKEGSAYMPAPRPVRGAG